MIKKLGMWIVILSTLTYAKDTFTVDELILKALQNSPDVQISSSEFEASTKRKDVAFSNYLPKVDLEVSGGEVGAGAFGNDMQNTSLILGKLTLKQLIYDFGKTGGNYDINKYQSEGYKYALAQKIADKKMEVKGAYYKVLQSIALIKVNKESVELNKAQLHRAKKYFQAGIKTKIDVSDAKVRLIKATLELKKSQYNLELAYTTLDKAVGFEDIKTDYSVYSKDLDLENLYENLTGYDLTLSEAILFAYKHRQNLKKHEVNIKVSQANVDFASSKYYPAIYLSGDYTKQDVNKLELLFPEDQYQALINLNWNLYEGGATKAATQEKQIRTMISASELRYAKLLIKERTTHAYINVNKMKDSVELSQSLLAVSKEKFDQAGKRYEHGISDYIELQEARQGYIDAMTGLVIDYYNYYNAIAILDNAIGK